MAQVFLAVGLFTTDARDIDTSWHRIAFEHSFRPDGVWLLCIPWGYLGRQNHCNWSRAAMPHYCHQFCGHYCFGVLVVALAELCVQDFSMLSTKCNFPAHNLALGWSRYMPPTWNISLEGRMVRTQAKCLLPHSCLQPAPQNQFGRRCRQNLVQPFQAGHGAVAE